MRRKILILKTVSCCRNCPHRVEFFDYRAKTKKDKMKCFKTKRRIRQMLSIPSWCPLEDYKEADHEKV